jgi:hypothetical protein
VDAEASRQLGVSVELERYVERVVSKPFGCWDLT